MGDIPPEQFDPLQLRYKQRRGGIVPHGPDISQPEIPIGKEEEDKASQVARIVVKEFHKQTIFVRDPNHIAPPVSASPIDASTGVPVVVPAATTLFPILTVRIPPNCMGMIKAFANVLDNPNAYGLVAFHVVYRGETLPNDVLWYDELANAIRTYQNIRRNMGNIQCPCQMPMPWPLREGDLEIQVSNNDVVAHQVEARVMGYQYVPDYTAATVDLSPEFKM